MSRSFECPHCNKGFIVKTWSEAKDHIKDCPSQYKNPQKRFKARMDQRKQLEK